MASLSQYGYGYTCALRALFWENNLNLKFQFKKINRKGVFDISFFFLKKKQQKTNFKFQIQKLNYEGGVSYDIE
jgi:hypothetical protein